MRRQPRERPFRQDLRLAVVILAVFVLLGMAFAVNARATAVTTKPSVGPGVTTCRQVGFLESSFSQPGTFDVAQLAPHARQLLLDNRTQTDIAVAWRWSTSTAPLAPTLVVRPGTFYLLSVRGRFFTVATARSGVALYGCPV